MHPMGLGDWRIATALITGFLAKESVVSTLSILFGKTSTLVSSMTSLSAASLLVFCLLYTPCVAAIASIKRELGGKWALTVVILQCVVAWIAAYIVYLIGDFSFKYILVRLTGSSHSLHKKAAALPVPFIGTAAEWLLFICICFSWTVNEGSACVYDNFLYNKFPTLWITCTKMISTILVLIRYGILYAWYP